MRKYNVTQLLSHFHSNLLQSVSRIKCPLNDQREERTKKRSVTCLSEQISCSMEGLNLGSLAEMSLRSIDKVYTLMTHG